MRKALASIGHRPMSCLYGIPAKMLDLKMGFSLNLMLSKLTKNDPSKYSCTISIGRYSCISLNTNFNFMKNFIESQKNSLKVLHSL